MGFGSVVSSRKSSFLHTYLARIVFFVLLLSSHFLFSSHLWRLASRWDHFPAEIARRSSEAAGADQARANFDTWLSHLRSVALLRTKTTNVSSARIGCREYEAGGQSCVFEGISCVDVRRNASRESDRELVYLLDDRLSALDNTDVPSDNWCGLRHQGADPRYYGPRLWPILTDTVAPQWSCMNGKYVNQTLIRTLLSNGSSSVKWFETMSLVDLDYKSNDHNYHLLHDIAHLLDTSLFQDSLDFRASPANVKQTSEHTPHSLFDIYQRHVLLPQGKLDFVRQTGRDINRLLYALTLRQNLSRLYPGSSPEDLATPSNSRVTKPLLEVFPEFETEEKLSFLDDLRQNPSVDLVCSARLTVGSKLGNVGHERTCRNLRTRSWDLFGIPPLPNRRVGQIRFNQPPKRLIVLQRHITRSIENIDALMERLKHEFNVKRNVEVELISTSSVRTAEDIVRTFSRAGVLLTPHGSQAQGLIWQPRHSAIIEIMPVGYTDYAFSLLAENCKIWHYELQSLRPASRPLDYYESECKGKRNRLDPCTAVKGEPVVAPIEETVHMVLQAFERLGYPMESWPDTAVVEEKKSAASLNGGNSSERTTKAVPRQGLKARTESVAVSVKETQG